MNALEARSPQPGPSGRSPARRGVGGLLRERDFRLLWIGETSSAFGSSVTSVAMPLVAVTVLHADALAVGVLTAAAWLPWLLIGLPAGAWVDRLPRRPVMLACDVVSALAFCSVPVAAWLGVLTIGHLMAAALVAGAAKVFFQTAYQVLLPSVVATADLREGNAKLQGGESAAQVAGPGAGGLAAQAFGAVAGLLADAATFVISAVCLLAMRAREAAAPVRETATLRRQIGEGMRFVLRDPYLRVLTLFGAMSNLFLVGYQAILVVFLVRDVGVSAGTAGGLIAATSVGGVAGAALATWISRRLGSARALIVCEVACTPFGLLLPAARPGPWLALGVAGALMVVAGVVAGNVIKGAFRQAYCPRHLLGRVSVTMQFVNLGTIPVGAVAAGALGDALGVRPAMWVAMAGVALSGLILFAGPLRRDRDLPTAPAAEA
ncbi:MFS transporter [Sphaerisporangium krabiense]|uniref:MFS family permease n=1 Tax=Sphaerisporangium krabiense TaxID=763782 RepID=A0A7W8Z821_9ACTN|nr:MFS transporter [Sphaerisporangium krabiense]MBB5629161.1 MFS family permease [Sphaerisporangium krabiense]GII59998.1 MFS transporter [Sphaerisporangium krabiense]